MFLQLKTGSYLFGPDFTFDLSCQSDDDGAAGDMFVHCSGEADAMASGKTAAEAIEIADSSGDEDEVEVWQKPQADGKVKSEGDAADAAASSVKSECDDAAGTANDEGNVDETNRSDTSSGKPDTYAFTRPSKAADCPICYCEFTTDDGVRLSSDCGHEFCQDCFSQYIVTKAKDGEVLPTQMVCPFVDVTSADNKKCNIPLAQGDVLACLASPSDRDRYLRLTLSRTVDLEDNMGCCPTAGCEFSFEWDEDNRKLECPLCDQSYCLVCRVGWHTGMRCEVFQEQRKAAGGGSDGEDGDEGDEAFRKFASKNKLKACPKCKFFVEKDYGCDAMHCRCGVVFCFKCGGCLKATAKKNAFKECKCASSQGVLKAHEDAEESGFNHNLENNGIGRFPAAGAGAGAVMGGGMGPWMGGHAFGGGAGPMGFGGGGIRAVPPPNHPARFGGGRPMHFPGPGQRLGGDNARDAGRNGVGGGAKKARRK